ncbi:glycerophosphodiester phosphodiesterase 1 [Galendromus occidentalis]|uniref:Glycerophosphodiester phosphodiesterase 1 n=1 Tax=Galendromus occidentalis TaxID=34638 RepID=A0AAJ6VWA3_9ACAR|nr:glycerophosphodiester phosphodiesterase 1 [Galendromus occidentalis]
MLSHLLATLFDVPAEVLVSSTRLSILSVFIIGALWSLMNTLTFIGILTALILALIYRFMLPKRDPSQIDGILGSKAVMFGHRGGALDAPENTLSAIRVAKKHQAYGVEIDLSFTKDNIAITFHDDDLDRTTNGKGPLLDSTWEVVKNLDASVNHMYSDLFKNEKVPTIDESVREALDLGLKIIIDVKDYDDRAVDYILSLYDKYPSLKNEAIVCSFYPQLVYKVRSKRSEIVTALIWRRNFVAYYDVEGKKPRFQNSPFRQFIAEILDPILEWSLHNFLWHLAGVSAVSIHKDHISKDYVDFWKARNMRVLSWTPNNPVEKEFLMHLNVSVITDTLV